ncbi:hypothetical protein J2X11_000463 [Aeromicrobium panaciterrae]|uniref:Uncharacterized protein n=1 Tax=Aeromicrobium panaciterrae TaxID=363861 RepID=A0ABU1UKD7_9ACTN|nr:hypothetical protein [Aeromicrobium panaciterrae]MDR7085624.1 hypothetical protein [Aeromicrobium panaciterrae]
MRKFTVILSAAVMALATVVSMSPAQAANYHVTASVSTSSAQSGEGPVIAGQLTPATPGKVVHLQYYYNGDWRTVETTSTNPDGSYTDLISSDDLGYAVGALKFRAKVVGADGIGTGASPTITKTIYGWQRLAYVTAIYGNSRRYVDGEGDLTVNGHSTASQEGWQITNPLVNQISTRYTKWNLQEKCIRLIGFAGIDDYASDVGAQGRLLIGLDGTSHDYDRTFDKNELAYLDKNLYKSKYLTFKGYKLNSAATRIGVGDPKVLCSKALPMSN